MADLIINGGKPLSGTIVPSGNKNSALPIFCATLLAGEPVRLLNVPDITDLEKLVDPLIQRSIEPVKKALADAGPVLPPVEPGDTEAFARDLKARATPPPPVKR